MKDNIIEEIRKRLEAEQGPPIYQRLANSICALIEEGLIEPGKKLPSIRSVATSLGVNNTTVISAYQYLQSKQLVHSLTGSGTYVNELRIPPKSPQPMSAPSLPEGAGVNFASSSTNTDLFPVEQFKDLFARVLERDRGNAFDYEFSQGYEPLRVALCGYLSGFGIIANPEQIQVISGAQQGIDIVAKAMLGLSDYVLVEEPTYPGAVSAFTSRGARVSAVPLEPDGMNMEVLTHQVKTLKPKLVYLMSKFQTPTGYSYSLEKKKKLLELASRFDFYILEEDNQGEFAYFEQPVPLKALDYKSRVIFLKSFSKLLMPGLRMGFLVLPKAALARVMDAKHSTDIETSGFIQRAFALFLEEGGLNLHLNRILKTYRRRYEVMEEELAPVSDLFIPPRGGLSFWLKTPENVTSEELARKILAGGVIVSPGALYSVCGDDIPYIRLSFAQVETFQMRKSLGVVINAIKS